MDVGSQVVAFHPEGALWIFTVGSVGGPVFIFKIMFKQPVIITAHPIGVMAVEAIGIGGAPLKYMTFQATVFITEMARSTPGTSLNAIVIIAWGTDMAVEARTSEQIVNQFQKGRRGVVVRDICSGGQFLVGTKVTADRIDLCCHGIME